MRFWWLLYRFYTCTVCRDVCHLLDCHFACVQKVCPCCCCSFKSSISLSQTAFQSHCSMGSFFLTISKALSYIWIDMLCLIVTKPNNLMFCKCLHHMSFLLPYSIWLSLHAFHFYYINPYWCWWLPGSWKVNYQIDIVQQNLRSIILYIITVWVNASSSNYYCLMLRLSSSASLWL